MKYRAKNDFFKSFAKGKVYNVEEVNTVEKYRFVNDIGHNYYMGESFLHRYFEKVEDAMKFKVGDKIKVRKDLEVGKQYGEDLFTNTMHNYLGKSATVAYKGNKKYRLDIDGGFYSWTDEMLEPVQSLSFDISKYIGKVIHCDTEEKANQLLEFLDGQGYKWRGTGERTTEGNKWKTCSENTCYCIETNKKITYDCIAYLKDTDCDIIEFDDLLKQDKPRICEIIGKEVDEKFNIKGYKANPCHIDKDGEVVNNQYINVRPSILARIINHPDLIEDIPKIEYTDRQKEAFKALKNVFNLNFVARDKDEVLWGYTTKPVRGNGAWTTQIDCEINALNTIHYDIFSFLKWEDEPFELPTIEEEV